MAHASHPIARPALQTPARASCTLLVSQILLDFWPGGLQAGPSGGHGGSSGHQKHSLPRYLSASEGPAGAANQRPAAAVCGELSCVQRQRPNRRQPLEARCLRTAERCGL